MSNPILELPIQYQTLNIDIEPVAFMRQFGPDAYDVANWTGTVAVNSPAEQIYRLVLPFAIESGTRATATVVSATDDSFDVTARFKKPSGSINQFLDYLKKMGAVPAEATAIPQELKAFVKGFKVTDLKIPAGSHIVRIHASQKLVSKTDDKHAYQLVMYAPLCNFVLAGGQTNLTALVSFAPDFQAPVTVEAPVIEALPGQTMPGEGSPAALPAQVANQKVFGWHWRSDPKVTINYRYN
ncbi:MAG: hypothetical protein Q7T74_05075 [Candidatus Saccharibacteria bacterium]|nr:hypothetical protein [Candidatus Saccharibacteria bacterium]